VCPGILRPRATPVRERRIAVPRDIAVTGFDDTVLSVATQPPLTTVRQPLEDLGRQAVSMLRLALADRGSPARSAALKATLIVRESSQRA
jgi:LacI family transcriptional regulator